MSEKHPNEKYTKEQLVNIMRNWYKENNKRPRSNEFNSKNNLPSRKTYEKKFNKKWLDVVEEILGEEVQTYNRLDSYNFTDKELLEKIKKEYERINPQDHFEFDKKSKGIPKILFLKRRFKKTYTEILFAAGVEPNKINYLKKTKEEYINLFNTIISKLGYVPSCAEFTEMTGVNPKCYASKLGTYNDVIISLGYTPLNKTPVKITETDEELLGMYINFCKKIGRLATAKDLNESKEIYNFDVFSVRFGSITELKKVANKKIGFELDKPLQSTAKYSKEKIKKLMFEEYKKKGSKLTLEEIKKNKNLPSESTIFRHFKETKISKIWNEVLEEKEFIR